ncbi:YxiG-like protein [Streptomyces solaniscabiei]|uniref:YxiG-like protein n=1 Tax=Streptomyces solaniscabiei TaxID=2683255 RepID=UPI003FD8C041
MQSSGSGHGCFPLCKGCPAGAAACHRRAQDCPIGIDFHDVPIETNAHRLTPPLLRPPITEVPPGYTLFLAG